MTKMEPIKGPNLTLRLIRPDAAAYVHGLRTDPTYNAHLSFVTGNLVTSRFVQQSRQYGLSVPSRMEHLQVEKVMKPDISTVRR